MYSSKESINILTALLIKSGVRYAVLCPGSRNVPIVHNFTECGKIKCISVTDERSAAFQALGIRLATGEKVVVCVTSGSALLNLMPGVAEANYRQAGLIVLSADRPAAWIDQNEGQTMPQYQVLKDFVDLSVNLPEISSTSEFAKVNRWHCERLVNEAILKNEEKHHPSVHINIPITEPLFECSFEKLPEVRKISHPSLVSHPSQSSLASQSSLSAGLDFSNSDLEQFICSALQNSRRPMIVTGQMNRNEKMDSMLVEISKHIFVFSEQIATDAFCVSYDRMMNFMKEEDAPDLIFYLGGNFISKKIKKYFRENLSEAVVVGVSDDGKIHDVFMHMDSLLNVSHLDFINALHQILLDNSQEKDLENPHEIAPEKTEEFVLGNPFDKINFSKLKELENSMKELSDINPVYSEPLAIKLFEEQISNFDKKTYDVHYGNSLPIRIGSVFAQHYIYVNRGLNGIEGSLSTAVGHAIATDKDVYCVIGDLSFFYDCNALWNSNLTGNFKILLLNNSKGGIFHTLPGLENIASRDKYVAAEHRVHAEGICQSFNINYMKATNMDELQEMLSGDFMKERNRPTLLEVFTDPNVDEIEYKKIMNMC